MCGINTKGKVIEILCFSHFARHCCFEKNANFGRAKQIMNEVKVSVVLELELGDTSN